MGIAAAKARAEPWRKAEGPFAEQRNLAAFVQYIGDRGGRRGVAERAPGPVLPVGDADPRDPAMPVRTLPRQCRFIGVLADRNILRKGQGAPAAECRRIEAVRQIVRHDRAG